MGLGNKISRQFCLQRTLEASVTAAKGWHGGGRIKEILMILENGSCTVPKKETNVLISMNTARMGQDETWSFPGESGGETTYFLELFLASNTCGGPGCLDSWLGWFLVLVEKPTQLVLHFLFALFLRVLLSDTVFPFEFFLIMEFSGLLLLIVLLRTFEPLRVPFLSSSVNKTLDYRKEATPSSHCCCLFPQKS